MAYYAGNFRQWNPQMRCLNCPIVIGGKRGTRPERVIAAMRELSGTIADRLGRLERDFKGLPAGDQAFELATVSAAIIGEFIRIHPFMNGNGRTSRVLWLWLMVRFGASQQVRIDPRPDGDYEKVMAPCMDGEYGPLAGFILEKLADPNSSLSL